MDKELKTLMDEYVLMLRYSYPDGKYMIDFNDRLEALYQKYGDVKFEYKPSEKHTPQSSSNSLIEEIKEDGNEIILN